MLDAVAACEQLFELLYRRESGPTVVAPAQPASRQPLLQPQTRLIDDQVDNENEGRLQDLQELNARIEEERRKTGCAGSGIQHDLGDECSEESGG